VLTAQRRMCVTVGGALSETVATVSLRTKRMLMFRLRNKKRSETGPDRRCSRPEQYQKLLGFDLYSSSWIFKELYIILPKAVY